MNKPFKPEGYNSVSPYFIVEGAQKMIDFLVSLFNARELRRYETPEGAIMHAEVQIDDSVIMISEATAEYPATHFLMHVYVPDVHATFAKAITLGCTSLQEPKQQEGDPDTRGMFNDFAGNTWAVGSQR